MKLGHLISLLPAVLAVASPALAQTQNNASAPFDLATRENPLPDQPAVGRSLFDYMMLGDDGLTMDVPFPIEKLVARLSTRTGVQPQVVMIPKGRSLQRDHADFASPRMIFGFDTNGKPNGNELGVMAGDRLFLGYSDKSDPAEVEVISYNAAAGRFEFQLVKDYRDGGAKTVVYADRTLCTKCHHNGAPMFGPPLWPDTNGTGISATEHKMADLIANAQHGASEHHTYPVSVPQDVPYKITEATKRANVIMAYQKLWMDSCGRDQADAPRCRGYVLQSALEMAFKSSVTFSHDGNAYTAMQASWQKNWPQYMPSGLSIPSNALLFYDPLTETGTNDGFPDLGAGLTQTEIDRITKMLAGSSVPKAKDPLYQLIPPLANWTMDSVCFGDCLVYGLNRFFTAEDKYYLRQVAGDDFTKLTAAIDALVAANDESLGNHAFRRGEIIRALSRQMGAPELRGGNDDETPAMPALVLDNQDVHSQPASTPLALIKMYCQPCHVSLPDEDNPSDTPGKRGFLRGTDAQITAAVKFEAKEIALRLNWTAAPTQGHPFMPPKSDKKHAALDANPKDRQKILDWVNSL